MSRGIWIFLLAYAMAAVLLGGFAYSCTDRDARARMVGECIDSKRSPAECAQLFGIKIYPVEATK